MLPELTQVNSHWTAPFTSAVILACVHCAVVNVNPTGPVALTFTVSDSRSPAVTPIGLPEYGPLAVISASLRPSMFSLQPPLPKFVTSTASDLSVIDHCDN